ncbi:carbon-nitrogen hydrolase [Heliocybe sulcata]|uniref:Carbon-nitrogen hydrolase n=1 Tax=Heliocybe sulcata TaxID=5364 RepID=A0A5C3NAK0_9AGAM|nr:carbon-nitrogen hydrolase [Heliocybe sulcata]
MQSGTVRVGAVQAEPVWWDLQGCVAKTVEIIQEAGNKGIKILGFPEVWICGYAWPLWVSPAIANVPFTTEYMQNSMCRDSPEMQRIKDACKEADVFAVVGYSERDGGSIYISQAFISNEGELVHNRRKIKPTHVERALWGDGQADSLKTVLDTPYGKLGALNCWENFQPLLRYHEYSQGSQIHVAGWPPLPWHPSDVEGSCLYNNTGEASQRISQNAAMEGQMFVICSTQVLKEKNHEKLGMQGKGMFHGDSGGFAMIFGPDGLPLVEPLGHGEEGILQADIDLKTIDAAKNLCDPVGHYSRPDLLALTVNTKPAKQVRYIE